MVSDTIFINQKTVSLKYQFSLTWCGLLPQLWHDSLILSSWFYSVYGTTSRVIITTLKNKNIGGFRLSPFKTYNSYGTQDSMLLM